MSGADLHSWQGVQDEVRRRIHARVWAPGEMIPNEQDLAREFGCARATVNRALRNLSEAGLLERRRKAGTRVAMHPVRKATLSIPMIRAEIEAGGHAAGYRRLSYRRGTPPAAFLARLGAGDEGSFARIKALHLADGAPFLFEDRWINLAAVPGAANEAFTAISVNEWLLTNAAYTHGEISFFARNAGAEAAGHLGCAPGDAIFALERSTWDRARPITTVLQLFRPGYRMQTEI